MRYLLLVLLVLPCALPNYGLANQLPDEVAKVNTRGFELARKYCSRCHGEGSSQGNAQFSLIDPDSMLRLGYVIPNQPDDSPVWQRLQDREMPPPGELQPSDEERIELKEWIRLGAGKPSRPPRPFRSELKTLISLREDLQDLKIKDRPFHRYFSLTALHNNSSQVSDFDLRYYRAALAKALNSLTWEPQLVAPRPIDNEATLLAIDLRDLGWDAKDWDALLESYPFGLRFDRADDEELARVASDVLELCGSPIAHLRADWFAVTATRPPLYHRLLDLPETDKELQLQLGVDVAADIRDGRAQRAGFAESGVSISNRLVERHPTKNGYYWKSYDFKRSNGTGSLFQFPLGPVSKDNLFLEFAFIHDGGEDIFSLPNGLQGYFLIDGLGRRIDAGPIEVVRDLKETSGTPIVVNGISCMHCHQQGMIGFRDSVRDGMAVYGAARKKTLELYPAAATMEKLVAKDRAQFVRSLNQVLNPWLVTEDGPTTENFGEPIAIATRFYNADVDLLTAAFELGLDDSAKLVTAIEHNPRLRRLGLGPLIHQQKIDRQVWQSKEAIVSPLQQVARELNIATPYILLSSP